MAVKQRPETEGTFLRGFVYRVTMVNNRFDWQITWLLWSISMKWGRSTNRLNSTKNASFDTFEAEIGRLYTHPINYWISLRIFILVNFEAKWLNNRFIRELKDRIRREKKDPLIFDPRCQKKHYELFSATFCRYFGLFQCWMFSIDAVSMNASKFIKNLPC